MDLVGFVNALLINIKEIAGNNDTQTKITPVGFLKMLYENNATTKINNEEAIRSGQDRTVKVRYMQRGLESEVSEVDDCETPVEPEWKETTITRPYFSKIGIFISDADMRKYEREATQTLREGTPATPLMSALYQVIAVKVNGLLQKMDTNLVTAQSTKWGKNVAYGAATAQTVNFGTSASLSDGYVKLLEDAQINEVNDQLLVCGNGIVNRYDIYNRFKTGADAAGIGALPLNSYYDPKSVSIWGANHFGVFAKGMVGIVEWNKNVGDYSGQRGNSIFFTLPLPVQVGDNILPVTFDAQLTYVDCPTYDDEGEKVADRGWKLIISKNYGLFNAPADAFASSDRLYQMNGSFHYVATNN